MNIKRLVLAIVVGFVFVMGSDYVVHEVWLKSEYVATMQLWRVEADMAARFPWMIGAQFLFAAVFVMIWAKGFADRHGLRCAVIYGLMMGIFNQTYTMIMYVVMPLPGDLAVKWFVSGMVQTVLLGIVTFIVYKPSMLAAK